VSLRPPILCDVDGVVWLLHEPIAGSVDAIARLRDAGHRVIFVTNNSYSTVREQEESLASIGIRADGDVVTSSQAAGSLLSVGERVFMGGGLGLREAVESSGAMIVGNSESELSADFLDVQTVVVGYHRSFDYNGLTRLSRVIRNGARLIATNDDATFPTPNGLMPGGGSILAAVATASGVVPVIAGKPHEAMANLVRRVSGVEDLSGAWMIGDRSSTDGLFARRVGCRFAHVMSGVVRESRPEDGASIVADDLAMAVEHILRSPQ
jgi:HAD superfamily hydrolase (TIGR01450 family)